LRAFPPPTGPRLGPNGAFVTSPLVGPFPPGADPESYDRLRRRVLWRMPAGIYLLGSAAGGRRNLMTHNLAMQVATEPKMLAVAVRNDAVTHELVHKGQVFSLSFVKREDRALVRAFTKPATEGPGPSMLAGVAVRDGSTGAPVLDQAAAWLECEVRHEISVGDHTLFVGEVVDCSAPDEEAPVLRMEDTRLNYGG
jgi:flavin reductase (DIM6/NTAB) family NADH-FMN oxidoreductase RutF